MKKLFLLFFVILSFLTSNAYSQNKFVNFICEAPTADPTVNTTGESTALTLNKTWTTKVCNGSSEPSWEYDFTRQGGRCTPLIQISYDNVNYNTVYGCGLAYNASGSEGQACWIAHKDITSYGLGWKSYPQLWIEDPAWLFHLTWTDGNYNKAILKLKSGVTFTQKTYIRITARWFDGDGDFQQEIYGTYIVDVHPPLTQGLLGDPQSSCVENTTTFNPLSLNSEAAGGLYPYKYTWQSSPTGSAPWTTISSQTSNQFTFPTTKTVGNLYYQRLTSSQCNENIATNAVLIKTYPSVTPGTITSEQTICNGSIPNSLSGSQPTGGDGNYTYKWQNKPENGIYSIIQLTNSSSFSPPSLSVTTFYQRIVSSGSISDGCKEAVSNELKITVNSAVTEGTIPSQPNICYNSIPATIMCSAASGGTNSYIYHWQELTGGVFVDIPNEDKVSFSPPALTSTKTYRRTATSCNTVAVTLPVTINVFDPFNPGSISQDQTISNGSTPTDITGIEPTGGTINGTPGTYTYQWEYSSDNSHWFPVLVGTFNSASYRFSSGLTSTTYYQRSANINSCGPVYSNSVKITVTGPLTEGTINASGPITICNNENGPTLSIINGPTGGSGNYSYLWQYSSDNVQWIACTGDGYNNSLFIPQKLNSTLYFRRQLTDATFGTIAYSNSIKLTVLASLVPGNISLDQSIPYNTAPITLTCSSPSGGDGVFDYQWQSSTDKVNFSDISGATSANYTSGKLATTTYFQRGAISSCGTVYSGIVTVNVYGMFLPGSVGNSQIICYGATPSMIVGSSPSGGTGSYNYQWQSSSDDANFFDLIGITASSYTPGVLTTTTYFRRTALSPPNAPVYSNSVKITVNGAVSEGTLSGPQTICNGSTANVLTVTAPTGGNGPGSYTYIWESCPDNYSWQEVPGVSSSSFIPENLVTTTYFRRKVTSGTCGYSNSNSVKITVYGSLAEGNISPDQTICYSSAPGRITLTIPTGGTGVYQNGWQWSTDNYYFTDIVGANQTSYIPPILTSNTYYRRYSISGTCGTAYSTSVKINVLPQVTAGAIMLDQVKCFGGTPDELTGTQPSGGNGPGSYGYQWNKSLDLNSWSDILGAQSNSYQPTSLSKTTYFRRQVTSGICGSAFSNNVQITITPALLEGIASQNQTVCYNAVPATLNVSTPSGGVPSEYNYLWQVSSDNLNWNNIPGANQQTYTPPALTARTYYRRSLTTQSCGTVYTNSVEIAINGALSEGTISQDQTICYNFVPGRITVTAPTGGTGAYIYGWQWSIDNYDWKEITRANQVSYIPSALTSTTYYRRLVHAGSCGTAYSNSMVINVLPQIISGLISQDQTICYNSTPEALMGEDPTGGTGVYSYKWEKSTDGNNYSNIANSGTKDYSPGLLTSKTYYHRIVTSGTCGSVTSNAVLIDVPGQLSEGTLSAAQTVCYNTSPNTLTSTYPTGGISDYKFKWQSSGDNLNWLDVPGVTSETFKPGTLQTDTFFHRIVSSGTCGSSISNSIKISVNKPVKEGIITGSQTICYNNIPATFRGSTPTGGTGVYSYKWEKSTDSIIFQPIVGAISSTFTEVALKNDVFYRRVATSQNCGSDNSNIISIKVLPLLTSGQIVDNQSLCYGVIPTELSGSQPTGGDGIYHFIWQKSSDNALYVPIDNVTSASFAPPAATVNTYYRRVVSSANCSQVAGNSILISVLPAINPGIISQNQTICYNAQPSMISGTVGSGGMGAYSYQWQDSIAARSWTVIPGETSLSITPNVLKSTAFYKRVTTSGTCGSVPSNIVTIRVYDKMAGGTIKGDQVICYNSVPDILTDSISPSGGNNSYTYSWQESLNKDDWKDISNTNSTEFIPGIMSQSKYYRRMTINTCGNATSNIITVNVLPDLIGGEIIGDQNICFGMKPNTFYGSNAMGGDGIYTYKWQYSNDNLSWSNLFLNGDGLNYSSDSLKLTTYYRRMARSEKCNLGSPSNTIKVTVSPTAQPGAIMADQTICYGQKPNTLKGWPAAGGTGNYLYNWESSSDGANWNKLYFYADSINYSPGVLTEQTMFHRKVSMPGCKDIYTNSVIISVNSKVDSPLVDLDSTYCNNSIVTLTEKSGSINKFAWFDSDLKLINEGRSLTIDGFTTDTKIFIQAIRNDNCTSAQKELLLKFDNIHASFSTDINDVWMGNAVRFTNESTGGKSYVWNFFDGDKSHETNPWHYYNGLGQYSVQLIAISPQNCQDTAFMQKLITVKTNLAMGTDPLNADELAIYPNPVNDFLYIHGGASTLEKVIITDIAGKTIINKELIGINNMSVNVSFLAPGMYTLKIKTNKNWVTFKIVKQ